MNPGRSSGKETRGLLMVSRIKGRKEGPSRDQQYDPKTQIMQVKTECEGPSADMQKMALPIRACWPLVL